MARQITANIKIAKNKNWKFPNGKNRLTTKN